MLSLCIALAGVPAQAMPMCPMAKMMQMDQVNQEAANNAHEGCDMIAKPKPKTGGCCDDLACSAKCSAMSGGVSIDLPSTGPALLNHDGQSLRLHSLAGALTSHFLDSQERPPRILA